ncbi:hypothetical protein RB195_022152 [Necator americanus]|uniref:Endonuclease/exonuclease/phosphatase domain-containing protein n=1 Tax=Necator americanus TaxID=51031 RepID=A0ABR1EE44_NECAM
MNDGTLVWPFLASPSAPKTHQYHQLLLTNIRMHFMRSWRKKSSYNFVVGDFNAKLGKASEEEYRIGRCGLEDRKENGNRLAGLLSAARLSHGNSLFMKKDHRRWNGNRPMARLMRTSTTYSPTGGGVYLTSQ